MFIQRYSHGKSTALRKFIRNWRQNSDIKRRKDISQKLAYLWTCILNICIITIPRITRMMKWLPNNLSLLVTYRLNVDGFLSLVKELRIYLQGTLVAKMTILYGLRDLWFTIFIIIKIHHIILDGALKEPQSAGYTCYQIDTSNLLNSKIYAMLKRCAIKNYEGIKDCR